jgi:hypothetical protein
MTAAAAWYPDPSDDGQFRWWDGSQWTEHVQPRPTTAATPQPAVTNPYPQQDAQPAPVATQQSAGDQTHSTVPVGLLDKGRGFLTSRRAVEEENERLRQTLAQLGVAERDALVREITNLRNETAALRAERDVLSRDLVETRDAVVLQEVGIYRYRHPLDDATAYKAHLAQLNDAIRNMARAGTAIVGATDWTINNSKAEGTKMVKDLSKLMLRAYNNEADAAVRAMKPYMLDSSIARLDKAATTVSKLGRVLSIYISVDYHRLRLRELELTADYLAKVAEEKERDREDKARLREEAKARAEYEREQARLSKELDHYRSALATLAASGDPEAIARAEQKVAEVQAALDGVNERAANSRVGYVYVISNIGSFGERMVKIGMTRRLEPMDRIRELGDASVPFRFDVHALHFSHDAVGVETRLHQLLADRRVNLVNTHREFFYATPTEVRDLLRQIEGELLHYVDEPEASEWHQSRTGRVGGPA